MGDTQHATTKVRPGGATSALVLEGKSCGLLRNVTGGKICADVVTEHTGPGVPMKKHLAAVRYEEFELEIGFTMEPTVYDWIASTWQMSRARHGGSILDCNEKLEVQTEREFTNALLTETTIPRLDARTKEAAGLRLKFAPEMVRLKKGSGKASGADPRNPEKLFVPSRFKLEIDGLDCSKVRGIDPFTVKQKLVREDVGESRDSFGEPGALSFPDLKIFFSEVMNDSWEKWFQDFVIQGKSGAGGEKSGKLTLLSPNQQPLASIAFSSLGPFEMGIETDEEGQRRGTARLYCEAMEFKLGA
jgi:hypothetical protein